MILRTNIASPLLLECLHKIMSNNAFDNHYFVAQRLPCKEGTVFPLILTCSQTNCTAI